MLAKTTLDQVARHAGVSASTVSRVLSGARGVNEGTRRKVLAAVREANYHPGVSHREPGHSRVLGFLMPAEAEQWGVRTNFTEQGLSAIGDVAAQFNYAAMVGAYHPELAGKVEDRMIQAREFAGALLFRTRDEIRDSEPFRKLGIPFLVVNRLLPETSLNYIGPDHRKVAITAARHLFEAGHRRVGLLLGRTSYASHRLYQEGFYQAHNTAKIAADAALITEIELNVEGGYAGTRQIMNQSRRPEALIVTGDRASLGCLKALHDMKIRVPREVAVVAMDGTSETAFANPPLTAVEIPWYDMLAMGTRLLIDLIEHRPPVEQIGVCYATRLVVRESTQLKPARDSNSTVGKPRKRNKEVQRC
ncbi:MAG TPA: LacI family DNA-binding transcriptional regulator [Bryobacteraceae bacterium]|jgi:DNA-binding LacI/PurR family transcriptional regulator